MIRKGWKAESSPEAFMGLRERKSRHNANLLINANPLICEWHKKLVIRRLAFICGLA